MRKSYSSLFDRKQTPESPLQMSQNLDKTTIAEAKSKLEEARNLKKEIMELLGPECAREKRESNRLWCYIVAGLAFAITFGLLLGWLACGAGNITTLGSGELLVMVLAVIIAWASVASLIGLQICSQRED